MGAFFYNLVVQWKLDIRNRGVVVTYYVVPLVFYLFMGGIFTSIMPEAYETLIQSMTVFGVTMGSMLGSPAMLVETYGSDIKKAYQVGGVPLWTAAAVNFLSAFLHLMLMSLFIYGTAPLIFDAVLPERIGAYFLSLALFIAVSLCLATLLGLCIKSSSKLTMAGQLFFLPSVMLSGIMFPTDMLPEILGYVGKALPATWGYAAMCEPSFSLLLPMLGIGLLCLIASIWRMQRIRAV